MARYNEILVGRYARGVQKLFGIKGEVPVGSLAGELQIVHSLFNGQENRYLESWSRFATAQGDAAHGAGTNSNVRLRNPANSNVVAVFEKVSYLSSAALVDNCSIQYQQGNGSDLGTVIASPAIRLDPRIGNIQQTSLIVSTGAAASTGFTVASAALPINSTYDFILTFNQELTLLPGDSLEIHANIQNQGVAGTSFIWRERFLEESERT